MRQAQLDAAWGEVFEVPGIINGSAGVRFMGIWPSGNVAVKRASDPAGFGPPQRCGETGAAYLKRLQAEGWLRPLRHPGNFVFTFGRARTP